MHLYNLWQPEMNQSFANKYMKTKYMIIWKLELWVNSQRIPLTHTHNYLSCYLLDWDNLPYNEYNFVKFHQYQFIHIKELQEIQEIFTEQSDSYINANMFKERFVVTMREGVKHAFTTYGHQSLSCLCRSNCSTHNLMPSCFRWNSRSEQKIYFTGLQQTLIFPLRSLQLNHSLIPLFDMWMLKSY